MLRCNGASVEHISCAVSCGCRRATSQLSGVSLAIAQLPILSMNGDVISFLLCAMCEDRVGRERAV